MLNFLQKETCSAKFVTVTCFNRQMARKFFDSIISWMIIYSDTQVVQKVVYEYNKQNFITNEICNLEIFQDFNTLIP